MRQNFDSKLKLYISRKILEDITDTEEQQRKIKYQHEGKTCHRGITEVKTAFSKRYYWPNMIHKIHQ